MLDLPSRVDVLTARWDIGTSRRAAPTKGEAPQTRARLNVRGSTDTHGHPTGIHDTLGCAPCCQDRSVAVSYTNCQAAREFIARSKGHRPVRPVYLSIDRFDRSDHAVVRKLACDVSEKNKLHSNFADLVVRRRLAPADRRRALADPGSALGPPSCQLADDDFAVW